MQRQQRVAPHVVSLYDEHCGDRAEITRSVMPRFLHPGYRLVAILVFVIGVVFAPILPDSWAAEIGLVWQDLKNPPAEVDTYVIYYRNLEWDQPAIESAGSNLTHTLSDLEGGATYEFSVTASDANGARESAHSNIVTATLPLANFSTDADANDPLTITFTDTSIGLVDDWKWDFGDGTTSTEIHPNHTYAASGMYTVSLTVRGPEGSDIITDTIALSDTSPAAGFTANPTSGAAPLTVNFSDVSTGNINTRSWNFGDGTTSTSKNPSHTYSNPGTYTVTLTVTGPGGSDSTSMSITVTKGSSPAEIHVADLDGSATSNGWTWRAAVIIKIEDKGHGAMFNAKVQGTWSGGYTGSGVCQTGSNGRCKLESGDIRRSRRRSRQSVTFIVDNVTHNASTYDPAANHDGDGDSDGTRITINRP